MSCLELYDRDAAVAYARQYALSYNPQYANYKSSTGAAGRGDCMNFVSQCLHAGGMQVECRLSSKVSYGMVRRVVVARLGKGLIAFLPTLGSLLARHACCLNAMQRQKT